MILVGASDKVLGQHLQDLGLMSISHTFPIQAMYFYFDFNTKSFRIKTKIDSDLYQYKLQTIEEIDMFYFYYQSFSKIPELFNNNEICTMLSSQFNKPLCLTPYEAPLPPKGKRR